MSELCPCSSGNLGESCALYLARPRRPAQTLLLSRFCAYVRARKPWGSLVSGGRASPSLLHLCALCDGSPGPPPPPSTAHSPLELQKPPPVNSSINNLCLSVSLPADCCLCACKIQLGCNGWGWGKGGAAWAEEGFGRHYCLPGWHFICNESWAGGGPRPESTTTRLLLFSSLEKKKNNLHVYFSVFSTFFCESRETTQNCVVLA